MMRALPLAGTCAAFPPEVAAIMQNLLDSRPGRIASFGILYVSEGIPLGFAAVAIAAYMRRQGLDVAQVGAFVASFYLPWAFKWSWAPLVDLVRLERLGGRKGWIVLCQAAMMVTLVVLSRVDFSRHFELLIALVLVHNVFAATNDIAIDSLAVNSLQEHERGTANGFMFGGAYLGQALGGGGAMFVAGRYGFDAAVLYVSLALSAILVFVVLFVRDSLPADRPAGVAREAGRIWGALAGRMRSFGRELTTGFFGSGPGPMVGVAFALLPMGAMALNAAVAQSMQVDLGMTDQQIAQLNVYTTVLAATGCVIGGWAADRFGHRRMLGAWYLLTALPTLYLASSVAAAEGLSGVSIGQFFVVSMTFNFCVGMHYGTGAALFMGLTNPLVAATQFTGYMALRNLVISYTNLWQGVVADAQGYAVVLFIDAALVLAPLLLLPLLRPSTRALRAGTAAGIR
jgi:PAT family beta-lactamase induction signal transducer AmpG